MLALTLASAPAIRQAVHRTWHTVQIDRIMIHGDYALASFRYSWMLP